MVLLVTVLLLFFSALPSVFGEREAVHVSHRLPVAADVSAMAKHLNQHGLVVHQIEQRDERYIVSLEGSGQQELARNALHKFFADDEVTIALAMEPAAPNWLTDRGLKPIKLGLDLRGGVQFLLDVDLAPVYEAHAQSVLDEVRREFRGVRGRIIDGDLQFNLRETQDATQIKRQLDSQFPHWSTSFADQQIRMVFSDDEKRNIRRLTVQQNLQTMRSRIEELGITEAVVQRQGENRIRIELPGIQDPAAAKDVIGATASLAFHALYSQQSNRALMVEDNTGNEMPLIKRPILDGKHIIDARAGVGELGTAEVNISLDFAGGRVMSRFSGDNIGQPMATVFSEYSRDKSGASQQQHTVISVATIQSQLGNRFRITGVGSMQQAQELALLLRAGSLTAPVTIIEERTIGPTLGAENVKSGFAALALGLSFTLVFIAFWYRRLGWVANAALLTNLVCLFGLIALIPGAVLTLPGIAGLVLTVGMAVDANVLIFERIKDKMREGRNLSLAIERGFNSAASSIFDANLTTMIVAIALYSIGNGPIQGFALTLGLGLLTSMFTGVFASRIMINLFWGKDTRKDVRI